MNKFNLFSALAIFAWLVVLICVTTVHAGSEDISETPLPEVVVECYDPVYDQPAQEPITFEDEFRMNGTKIEDCKITHYCAEQYKHICGTGDGLTSTGVPVTPYWTCAVDPDVIPYGADVMVDYGDHVEFWQAQDCGSAINGNHIDLAVETHSDAELLGITYATVYWMEVEREFN